MSTITPIPLTLGNGGFADLGIHPNDYALEGSCPVDYQTLAVDLAQARAHALEEEIAPLANKMEARNDELALLGDALAVFTEASERFASDAEGSDTTTFALDSATYTYLTEHHLISAGFSYDASRQQATATKSALAGASEAIKTRMDGLNNAAQTDMTRLESLVARRDEAFEAASSFLNSISGSRDTVLQGMSR